MLAMLQDQFGIDLAKLMQAKIDAATVRAEQVTVTALPKDGVKQ